MSFVSVCKLANQGKLNELQIELEVYQNILHTYKITYIKTITICCIQKLKNDPERINEKDYNGFTPLHYATFHNYIEIGISYN